MVEWGRTLLWLNLLATAVVFSARTTEGFELPKTAVVRGVGLVLAVGAVVVFAATGDRRARLQAAVRGIAKDAVAVGVVLSLGAAAISTMTSVSPRTSLLGAQGSFAGLYTLAAFAVIFFATRSLCRTADASYRVLSGAVSGIGVAVGYGVVQLAGLDPLHWEAPIVFAGVRRVFSTQGHPNSLAQLLVEGAPLIGLFLARGARARRYGEAMALGLVGVGALGLLVLTFSRAGALALAAAAVVTGWGWWRAALPNRRRWLVFAGSAAIALGVLMMSVSDEGLRTMGRRLAGGAATQSELRRFIWSSAWAAFLDHPVSGVGVDCLSLVFGRYRTAAAWSAEWGETPLKAHFQALEVLATRGLLGGVAALVLLLGVLRAGIRAVGTRSRDPELGLAAAAGLVAFLVHISFHFPTAAATSLAVTLAAVLSVLAREEGEVDTDIPRARSAVPFAAVGIAGVMGYWLVLLPLRADVLGQAGGVVVHTDPARARALEREAVRLDPSRDLLWLRFAAALQADGLGQAEPSTRRSMLQEARRAAEYGVELVPVNAYNQAHLGTLLADLEREGPPLAARAEVEGAFERAHGLDPNNADISMEAADAALAAGDLEHARAWAMRASVPYPGFGRPKALLGAAALVEGRRLAENGQAEQARDRWADAVRLLREGLAGEWHGEEASRTAAETNLPSALAALGNP
jgi:O-antigen ligase